MKPLLLAGDAHLRDGDPEVEVFLEFLRTLPGRAATFGILGDLFDLWIGDPAFLSGSHRRVLAELRSLRSAGVRLLYVEGNRDYHIRPTFGGDPFDEVAEAAIDLEHAGRRIHLAHGDLVNRGDRPYRLWRRLAKGPVLLGALRLLPDPVARALAARIERGIARTNRRHRIRFPEEECREYATRRLQEGTDRIVLGHFHEEMRRVFETGGARIEVLVLPAWREGHRYLCLEPDGTARFESFHRREARSAG